MKYKIDVARIRENSIVLNGWVIGKKLDDEVEFQVVDGQENPVEYKYVPVRRDDVSQIYFKKTVKKDLGFDIRIPYIRDKRGDRILIIRCKNQTARIKLNTGIIETWNRSAHKKSMKLKNMLNMQTFVSALDFYKENGLKALWVKSKHKLHGIDSDYDYPEWVELTKTTQEELEQQKKTRFEYMPKLSVVVPAYKTPERFLSAMFDSLLAQTYVNWEVCVADGSPKGEGVERVLKRYALKDERIRYVILGENLGIAGNTNAAMEMVSGDFIVLADHDDTLAPDAFFECVKAINIDPEIDVVYTDEDKLDIDGGELFEPHFKPDFNPELLTSVNYICHLFVVSRELSSIVGGFQEAFDGAQDYDFILRCTEKARRIYHVPKALYHWRCHQDSTASNPESKLYAFEAGANAIKAHYERLGIPVCSVEKGVDYGIYHSVFEIEGDPLVSIIIPNKDHTADLDLCMRSIIEKSTFRNFEFIIVENNSTKAETFAYYEKILKEFENIRVVTWKQEFNYSAINNFGVTYAKGEYLLFLNNDTEIIRPESLYEMLGYCQRNEIGVVGVRLLYSDDTIQHAGVVVGFGGIAGHTFIGLHMAESSYFNQAMCARDYSAVTAACMMSKRSLFDKVGGFSEDLAVAFNDIDYCMKIRSLNKRVVYNPYALFYHYESKSRGLEDTPEKIERFHREIKTFKEKWQDILIEGDPYYNPNLTLRKSNFALRDLKKEKIGEPYRLEV